MRSGFDGQICGDNFAPVAVIRNSVGNNGSFCEKEMNKKKQKKNNECSAFTEINRTLSYRILLGLLGTIANVELITESREFDQ